MASARRYEHTEPIFLSFKLLTLRQIYVFNCGMFMFKRFHSLRPDYFNELFCMNRDMHSYNTRQRNSFYCKEWKLDIMRRSIRIQGPLIWNKIDAKVDVDCSLAVFKYKIKDLLHNQEI